MRPNPKGNLFLLNCLVQPICDPARQDHPPAQYKPSKINASKPVPNPNFRVSSTQSQTSSTCLPYYKKQASRSTTQPLSFKDFSTPGHKDKPDPSDRAGVYEIPCECGNVYIGETVRNLPTRLKEHRAHSRRGDIEKSVTVKHSHIKDYQIDWQTAQKSSHPSTHGIPDASERPSRS